MLEIKNLHVAVDGKQILKGLNLTIQAGETHAIMGPNGSGKSTLSYVLAGRAGYDITDGSIRYNGEDLAALAIHHFQVRRRATALAVLKRAQHLVEHQLERRQVADD